MSEIIDRADELRAIAAKPSCKTLNDFARETGWTMEIARHANQVLALNLPDAKLQAGKRIEAQSVPKPVSKKNPKA